MAKSLKEALLEKFSDLQELGLAPSSAPPVVDEGPAVVVDMGPGNRREAQGRRQGGGRSSMYADEARGVLSQLITSHKGRRSRELGQLYYALYRVEAKTGNLSEALDELEKDDLVRETLGEHIFQHFVEAKREEWFDYIKHVSPWEIERYLAAY